MGKPYWMNDDQYDAVSGKDTADIHADCKTRLAEIVADRDRLLAALKAVERYDRSIAGAAARGEVKLNEAGHAYAEGDELNNLDELYEDMVRLTRSALAGR